MTGKRHKLLKRTSAFLLFVLALITMVFDSLAAQVSARQLRIVGGTNALPNSAPYIVSIQFDGVHYCGGSILNAHWVVTVAHCLLVRQQVLRSILIAGSKNVAGDSTTTQIRSIDYFVKHDFYFGGASPYDIGLVYTKTSFDWTKAVSSVKLPAKDNKPTGTATLYGWGSTSNTNVPKYPNTLQVAYNLPIISNSKCEKVLGKKGADVHDTNICTLPQSGGTGICTGDSGGPLVQTIKGVVTLVGIVSWTKTICGQPNTPSVYVQVSSFLKWIKDNQRVNR